MTELSESMKNSYSPILFIIVWLLSGCATWHQRTMMFSNAISTGEFTEAEKILQHDKQQQKGKNKILYLLNLGYVEFMLGKQIESNEAFSTAEQLIETQIRQPLAEAGALLTNPEVRPYRPEDFEIVMINVYKALNYLSLHDLEGAMVEARRINIRLKQLNNKYPDHKARYQQDAFAHLIMGWIYDASSDYNNAFIAYRNAYNIYNTDYKRYFNLLPPRQLKEDMIRTAQLSGLQQEAQQYAKEFDLPTVSRLPIGSNLLFLWMNGLGPYKSEWGINFVMDPQKDGVVLFHNKELGLSFPFYIPTGDNESSLANVQAVRVAFPKYVERKPPFRTATIIYNQQQYPLEAAEDINAIAFKSLHDRMLRECSISLLRLAAKQGIKQAASNQNEWLGFAVGIANAMTEKADTRNWQTLPHTISFCRIPLDAQHSTMLFNPSGGAPSKTLSVPHCSNTTEFEIYTTF